MPPNDADELRTQWLQRLTQSAADLDEGKRRRASGIRARLRRVADATLDRSLATNRSVSTVIDHFHPEHTIYEASGWSYLPRALHPWEVGPDDVFADLGCGRGRIVYLAARWYRFRRVIGVDISPELVAHAEAIISRDRSKLRCQDVELICTNAQHWDVPDDVTVLYLFYPFSGATLEAVIANLEASLIRRQRHLRVLFAAPRQTDVLTRNGHFRLVRTSRMLGDDIMARIEIFESTTTSRKRRSRPPPIVWQAVDALRATRSRLRSEGLVQAHENIPALSAELALDPLVRMTMWVCRATCLERALIAQAWRASQGDKRDLVIGVKLRAGEFGAHAWLSGYEGVSEFQELMRLPPPTDRTQ